jgi:hypothetical protein
MSITQRLPEELQDVMIDYAFDAKTDYARMNHQFKMLKLGMALEVLNEPEYSNDADDDDEDEMDIDDWEGMVEDNFTRFYALRFLNRPYIDLRSRIEAVLNIVWVAEKTNMKIMVNVDCLKNVDVMEKNKDELEKKVLKFEKELEAKVPWWSHSADLDNL